MADSRDGVEEKKKKKKNKTNFEYFVLRSKEFLKEW